MTEKIANTYVSHQVSLSISGLKGLSILPQTAASILSKLNDMQLVPSELVNIAQADCALAACLYTLCDEEQIASSASPLTIAGIIEKVPLRKIRDAVLALKVYDRTQPEEIELRIKLQIHAVAAAICARRIAEVSDLDIHPHQAFLAGLFHNIGNLALDEVMPRSFRRIWNDTQTNENSLAAQQLRHLGIDYSAAGRRLARQWKLPAFVAEAIWLQNSKPQYFHEIIPEANLGQLVHLACLASGNTLAQTGCLGQAATPSLTLLNNLRIDAKQLEEICETLPEDVARETAFLQDADTKSYFSVLQKTASTLANENSQLAQTSKRFERTSGILDFLTELQEQLSPFSKPIEIAQHFILKMQSFYQTGPVAAVILDPSNERFAENVYFDGRQPPRTSIVHLPETQPDWLDLNETQACVKAGERIDWLARQLDVDFDRNKTMLLPLTNRNATTGVLVFECHYPGQLAPLQQELQTIAAAVAFILQTSLATQQQQTISERFAQAMILTQPQSTTTPEKPVLDTEQADESLSALAEMASGTAHELNNPLSVISGRAQLLAESETDEQKRNTLQLIRKNASDVAGIIGDLMSYAEPPTPHKSTSSVSQIIDEAVQLAVEKTGVEELNVQLEGIEDAPDLFVDSAQIASAMANIIANSIEAYKEGNGPVKIVARKDGHTSRMYLDISDLGRGMDQTTINKALHPFFSSKPAGRQRGMGLSHAERLIRINSGSLHIESQPGEGTIVTVTLPTQK